MAFIERKNSPGVRSRRSFLGTSFAASLGGALLRRNVSEGMEIEELPPGVVPSNPRELLYPTPEPNSKIFSKESGSFAASYPLLQNVSETSASISWALNTPSTGWVEWGRTPALGKIARHSEFGLNPYEENFLSAQIFGLEANTEYFYRTATCSFSYQTAYQKTISEPQYSEIFSFKTMGANRDHGSFAVMNDTHNQIEIVRAHCKRHNELNPDVVVWNGDLCHRYFFPLIAKTAIANPCDEPFAARRPLLFVPGNHDKRGPYAHALKECLTPWRQPDPNFRTLGYNAAFRNGPIAMITLDTGETGPDSEEESGIYDFEPYRALQTAWLEKTLSRPDIASAPYIVVFCHVPIFNTNGKKDTPPTPPLKWSAYSNLCAPFWGPVFEKHRITLLVAAHIHRFTYFEATPERPWPQITGGGPLPANAAGIHAEADNERLIVTAERIEDGSVLGSWSYRPRF